MPTYLSATTLSKSYGVHTILDGVSFILNNGERLGLVGANGVGKSTLLKIITGELEPDGGQLWIPPDATLGYLRQETDAPSLSLERGLGGEVSISDFLAHALAHLHELEGRLRDLEEAMATVAGPELDAILNEYQAVTDAFERAGGYDIEYRITEVLDGLGVGHIPHDRGIRTLSGGEKARLGLAMLLLQSPDILLLDEPTNHLDHRALTWLETYLQSYPGGVLSVSHDRQFLNRTVTAIIEIDEHTRQINHYAGNYDAYLVAKAAARLKWEEDYARQQEEIKELKLAIKTTARQVAHNRAPRDNDGFIYAFKGGNVQTAVARRVHSAEEKLRRIEETALPRPPAELRFTAEFDPTGLAGNTPLYASGIFMAYEGRPILENVSLTLGARSRIALVGPNGAGKSTLLKILAGQLVPDAGEIYVNPQVTLGYLDQEGRDLDPNATVVDAYRAPSANLERGLGGEVIPEQQAIATLITSGMFRYDDLERRVGDLSSGQRRKLQIARLIANRANLLLLDEPTNYVSFDVLESLETALRDFPGPVIAATHDRRFLQQFDGDIWELRDGRLIEQVRV